MATLNNTLATGAPTAPEMMKNILFAEDSYDLGNLIKQYLEMKGFSIDWYVDSEEALEAFKISPRAFSLCLLDVQMPNKSGFELAKEISRISPSTPFVFLTARTEKQDRLQGLDIGAADYITKPFDIDELVLRIRNIIKRTTGFPHEIAASNDSPIGDIIYNKERLTLTLPDGKTTTLTLRESELLEFFTNNKNRRIKKEEILVALWGENDYFLGRSLDVFISRLRKILAASSQVSISNVYGAGYIFNVAEK
ncbi:MAG TPA: response regulator transcription factor [Flavisolibacter sp.]|jgi:DNA-binding response OmpR family regulator|nr:response regulator transcription factor [Flavisolibacter sp.]